MPNLPSYFLEIYYRYDIKIREPPSLQFLFGFLDPPKLFHLIQANQIRHVGKLPDHKQTEKRRSERYSNLICSTLLTAARLTCREKIYTDHKHHNLLNTAIVYFSFNFNPKILHFLFCVRRIEPPIANSPQL